MKITEKKLANNMSSIVKVDHQIYPLSTQSPCLCIVKPDSVILSVTNLTLIDLYKVHHYIAIFIVIYSPYLPTLRHYYFLNLT